MLIPTYDYNCPECKEEFILFSPFEERDKQKPCPACGGEFMTRHYGKFPGIARASHPDGRKTEANEDLKEATKLEIDSYDIPPAERSSINREINNLKSTKEGRAQRRKK